MGKALDGTWSNHSGFLARTIADELPETVRVEPQQTFLPAHLSVAGLRALLEEDGGVDLDDALSVHLWAHVWWDPGRRDFSGVHAGLLTADHIASVDTTYNRLARPYLPDVKLW